MSLTGFDPLEIDSLLAPVGQDAEVDAIPEPPLEPVTRPHDLWCCGEHRLLCGDATLPADVARLLGAQQPHLMVTDPPYGVSYEPAWRERAGLGHQRQTGTVINDDRVDWSAAYRLFPGDVVYLWHAGVHTAEVAASLQSAGFEIRSQIIWAKQHFVMSRGHYHWQHEPCWYVVRKGRPAHWRGDRAQSTLWRIANLNPFGGEAAETATGHGTQKPVALMRIPLRNHTDRGDRVYDPFLGSGSTLMAAETAGRICCGIEIDPAYVDVALCRWQQRSGGVAILEGDGRTFDQIHAERATAAGKPRKQKSAPEGAAA